MLKQLRKTDESTLVLTWDDQHEGPVSLRSLRDRCPCAGCSGETVMLRRSAPLPQDLQTPGRYQLVAASPVGNYAMKLSWGDGHDHGIYTWGYLRSLCECAGCLSARMSGGS